MTWKKRCLFVAGWLFIGEAIPLSANLISGHPQYAANGLAGIVLIEAFNIVPVLMALLWFWIFSRMRLRRTAFVPPLLGASLLSIGHFLLDLSSDAQAGVALIFLPLHVSSIIFAVSLAIALAALIWRRFRMAG